MFCGLLRGLNTNKYMGPDRIHARVLTEVVDIIATPLSMIFQKTWRSGDTPDHASTRRKQKKTQKMTLNS